MEERYSRQTLFAGIGEAGQRKLAEKHVLIVGSGALGTGNAEILTRAGVGKLTIVDRDYVEWSNLQRQQLFTEKDAIERIPKAISAKKRLEQINSKTIIEAQIMDININEIHPLTEQVDLIIDGTDNFETRMLLNDISQRKKIPWILGACVGSYGLSYCIIPDQTPCFACLLEKVPIGGATCDTAGIIAPTVQMVVSYQTAEALKVLTEEVDALRNKLVSFDLWKNQHAMIGVNKLKKDTCPSCGTNPVYPYLQIENQTKTAVLCGRNTVQIRPPIKQKLDLHILANTLSKLGGQLKTNPYLISFKKDAHRLVIFQDGRVLVHGTKDIAKAKTLYHRYVG